MQFWTIKPKWEGQVGFVLCGGFSVVPEQIEELRGQNLVAINSAYEAALWAPILFFADERWWRRETGKGRKERLKEFKGTIATISRQAAGNRLKRLRRSMPPPGLAKRPDTVAMRYTSLQAGLNICVHRGVSRIVVIGADGRYAQGKVAHFHEEYPWRRNANTWTIKEGHLKLAAGDLKRLGIEVINASPNSALPWWPKMTLAEAMREVGC